MDGNQQMVLMDTKRFVHDGKPLLRAFLFFRFQTSNVRRKIVDGLNKSDSTKNNAGWDLNVFHSVGSSGKN